MKHMLVIMLVIHIVAILSKVTKRINHWFQMIFIERFLNLKPKKGFSYPPLNKPHAILNWLSKHGTELPDDHEIIIVDTGT